MSESLESSSVPMPPTDVVREPTVGERLSQAREARGLSVDDVASALKLGPRQVAALEAGDWQSLPGNAFARGFVRNYARYLELEVGPLMAALDQVLKQPADTLKVDKDHPAEMPAHGGNALFHKSRHLMLWLAGIVLVEWPDRLGAFSPADALTIRLSEAGADAREAEITGWPDRLAALA